MLSKYLPRNALCQIYKSYVRSQLDYGDVVYHNPSKTNDLFCSSYLPSWMEKLESVQYAAALAVTGAWREPLVKNFIMSLDGNPLIVEDGVGV